MRAFQRRGEEAVAWLDADEREGLATVVAGVRALTEADPSRPEGTEPEDDETLRLFPNAAPMDQTVAQDFRQLTEPNLRALKTSRLDAMLEYLTHDEAEWIVLLDEALSIAAALTDVRLVLATRLGLKTDEDAELLRGELEVADTLLEGGLPEGLDVDRERVWFVAVYQALTWLQHSLVACLMDQTGDDQRGGGDE